MPPRKPLYSPHPSIAMVQKWIAELPGKAGRSLDEWLALIAAEGPAKVSERRAWLKQQFGLGTNTAWWLADRSVGNDTWDDDPDKYLVAAEQFVQEMFAGNRAGLRP